MTVQFAKQIQEHLIKTGQGFCFTTYGLISREYLTEAFGLTFTSLERGCEHVFNVSRVSRYKKCLKCGVIKKD